MAYYFDKFNKDGDSNFRASEWEKLSPENRLIACQSLENRLAAERGSAPRTLVAEPMKGGAFGYQQGDKIYINSYLLERNQFLTENGYVDVPAAGWQIYDTVCHEDLHGMMEDTGKGQTFATYIGPDQQYEIYRIQHDEKYAFAVGQDRTLTAVLEQKAIHGLEDDMVEYKNIVKADRYQDWVANASEKFGISDIDHKLDQLVYDKENGIVPEHPSNDYRKLDNAVYGANHQLDEEEEGGESEGNHGQPAAQQTRSLSYNNFTENYSQENSQEQRSLSYSDFMESSSYSDEQESHALSYSDFMESSSHADEQESHSLSYSDFMESHTSHTSHDETQSFSYDYSNHSPSENQYYEESYSYGRHR